MVQKEEIRNIRYGGSMTATEIKLINDLSKSLNISKTELIARAVNFFSKNQLHLKIE